MKTIVKLQQLIRKRQLDQLQSLENIEFKEKGRLASGISSS